MVIIAYMLPEFLFIIPMYSIYQTLGLYDAHIGLALMYQYMSYHFLFGC